jgi:hypothetical protein
MANHTLIACVSEAFPSGRAVCTRGVQQVYRRCTPVFSPKGTVLTQACCGYMRPRRSEQTQNRPQMAFSYTAFSACVSDRWQPTIGDPNIAGWAICAAYALAAILAVIVLREAPFAPAHRRREQVLWLLIACLMAVLALNKQLDLQSLMLAAGRCLAQEQGWYENRRLVQRDFILALIAVAALGGAAIIWLLRGIVRHNLMALLGLACLAGFVLIRGGHFFHMFVPEQEVADRLLHHLTALLEAMSLILIIAAAGKLLRQARPQTEI